MPSEGQTRRQQEQRRREKARKANADIGEIPPVQDPERRNYLEQHPDEWLRTYLPDRFFLDFSESQKNFISLAWNAIQNRGKQNINAYRGFGKTSLESGLLLMSHMMGHTRNGIYVSAEGGAGKASAEFFADALFEPIPADTGDEDLEDHVGYEKAIVQDYPEICYPISKRDNVAQKPLEYHGWPCNIKISPEKITFPLIDGTRASGSKISFTSILSSSIRGTFHNIRRVGAVRPDIVMIDDVQSDGAAKSETEVDNIINVIKKSIEGLAGVTKDGYKQPLIILSALTQNQPNDVACRMLEEMPDYCTVIYRFLRSVPVDFTPWRDYREFRRDQYLRYGDKKTVTAKLVEYYNRHRTEIEFGCVADNPGLREDWQVSAIHFAVEKWAVSEEAFWCELQNDSVRAAQTRDGGLEPVQIVPVIRDHNQDEKVGQTTVISRDGGQINADAEMIHLGIDDTADNIMELWKRGARLQASVRTGLIAPEHIERIEPGVSCQVNSQTFQGPCEIVRKWKLREISIVTLDADDAGTNVFIEAALGKKQEKT